MAGPVLSVPISSAPITQLGTLSQRAKSAKSDLQQLEKQLLRMAASGNVPDELNKQLSVAREHSDELKILLTQQSKNYRGFKAARSVQRFGTYALQNVASAIKTGDYGSLLYSAESVLSSERFRRFATKLNFVNIAEKAMKVIPAAFIIKEGIDAVKRTYEENIKNRTGRSALKGMFGRGEIDKETYLALYDTGKFYSTDPGYRDSLSGLTGGLVDSSETMRERLLKAGEGNKEQDRLRLFALSQMALESSSNGVLNRSVNTLRNEGVSQFESLLRKQEEAIDEKAKELQVSELSPAIEARIRRKIQVEFAIDNPELAKLIEKADEKARDIKNEAGLLHPVKDKNNSILFIENDEEMIQKEIFKEYRHGYTPFNRTGR